MVRLPSQVVGSPPKFHGDRDILYRQHKAYCDHQGHVAVLVVGGMAAVLTAPAVAVACVAGGCEAIAGAGAASVPIAAEEAETLTHRRALQRTLPYFPRDTILRLGRCGKAADPVPEITFGIRRVASGVGMRQTSITTRVTGITTLGMHGIVHGRIYTPQAQDFWGARGSEGVASVVGSPFSASDPPLLVGDFGHGAYGPTLLIILPTRAGASWLQGIFETRRQPGGPIDLTAMSEARIVGIQPLLLSLRQSGGQVRFRETSGGNPPAFELSASPEGWADLAALLDPFVRGEPGHQYLTREDVDDALIEVSFGEPEVTLPDREAGEKRSG